MNNINLSTKPWNITSNFINNKILTTCIPFDVHNLLVENDLIPHPYLNDNEKIVQEVHKYDWTLERNFSVNQELLDNDEVLIDITRIDTFADVFINDNLAFKTQNNFAKYSYDIKSLLVLGNNTIKIVIKPIFEEITQRKAKLPFEIPYAKNNQIEGLNLIRKPHCHAGWDWGITLIALGIYNEIFLTPVKKANINYIVNAQKFLDENIVEVTFKISLRFKHNNTHKLAIKFAGQTKSIEFKNRVEQEEYEISFTVKNPQLWFPHGYGKQYLYEVIATLDDIENYRQTIGIRKMEVINEKDQYGQGLSFRVNDIDIFAKGCNWIPCDAMPSRQTYERTQRLLEDVIAGNMNMIRIWGGGQYEPEYFYQLCDELGILIWHDVMLSCSLYPSEDWFINDLNDELNYQVPRISSHPSLALWCGDNEVIGAIDWYDASKNNRDRYIANYARLSFFMEQKMKKLIFNTTFWPSSPSNGHLDFGSGWHNDSEGDMHYWTVWHNSENFEAYYQVQPRFCSEFGFQAFPDLPSIKKFADDKHLNLTSPVMELHNKQVKPNGNGNTMIIEMLARMFRTPIHNAFEKSIYLSQVQQALAITMGIEYWRSTRPVCMGTLFWQINDNWPTISWASIDYYGKWKILHYWIKNSFKPFINTMILKDNHLKVSAVNDCTTSQNIEATLSLVNLENYSIEESWTINQTIDKLSALETLNIPEEKYKDYTSTCFILLQWKNEAQQLEQNILFFDKFKRFDLPLAEIVYEISQQESDLFSIKLKSDKPAFFVNLEVSTSIGVFSDNGFYLHPQQEKTISFNPRGEYSLETLKKELRIYHLAETQS